MTRIAKVVESNSQSDRRSEWEGELVTLFGNREDEEKRAEEKVERALRELDRHSTVGSTPHARAAGHLGNLVGQHPEVVIRVASRPEFAGKHWILIAKLTRTPAPPLVRP